MALAKLLSCFKASVSGPIRGLWFVCSEVEWVQRSVTKRHTQCVHMHTHIHTHREELLWVQDKVLRVAMGRSASG